MKTVILLAPVSTSAGLFSASLGVMEVLKNAKILAPFLNESDSVQINDFSKPLSVNTAAHFLSQGDEDKVLEFIVGFVKEHSKDCDIVVIKGVVNRDEQSFASRLNQSLATALSASVIMVASPGNRSLETTMESLEIEADNYENLLGCILNKVGAPTDQFGNTRIDLFDPADAFEIDQRILDKSSVKVLGCIPWNRSLMATDIDNIIDHVGAEIHNSSTYQNHKIENYLLAAATWEHASDHINSNALIITSGDRSDIILGTCKLFLEGVHIGGLLLTANLKPAPEVLEKCKEAMDKGLPILFVKTDSLRTSIALQNIHTKILKNDEDQLKKIKDVIVSHIKTDWIKTLTEDTIPSPTTFKFNLFEKAKSLNKKIILPEGDDIRIIKAANESSEKEIAQIILLGKQNKIDAMCQESNITLNPKIEVIDPESIAPSYVSSLVEIRKHKGMTEELAKEALKDPITVSMMMLKSGDADGLVAGANTTTAAVVSPALKILKTAKGAKLVSSIFFMCLKSEVLVYGDCAINQNPTAEGLADIAIQSATSAQQFGIDPKIAMISYSTGSSGTGEDVEKVKQATEIVNEKRPDLVCDGPLQYDAAKVPEVAAKKAPQSPIAGAATVFIFPDLNTANTTYKAVQRSANALSIGPMLQGLAKPVNDLSRGATIEDIIYTIAITSIQGS